MKSFVRSLLVGGGLIAAATPVFAASFYWDADIVTATGQNGDGVWTTDIANTNWSGTPGGTPNISWVNGSGNTAFLGNANGTNYTNPAVGGTITLAENITAFAVSMSSGQTGSYIINGGAGLALTLSGTGAYLGNNSPSAVLTVNADVTGTSGLQKVNTGRVIFTGTGTYTGVTKITGGTLQFGREISLYNNTPANWTADNLIVLSGATLALNVGGTGEFTSAEVDALVALGGATTGFLTGSSIGFDTTTASGGSFTYASILANPNAGANTLGLAKLGTNSLILSAANTYSGGTALSGGTIGIGNGSALGTGQVSVTNPVGIFAADSPQSIANNFFLSSTGSSVLTVSGPNSLTLNGTLTGSGSRTITNTIPAASGTLTLAGTLNLSESSTQTRTFTIGSATAAGSTGTTLVTGTIQNNGGTNTLASNFVASGGGTVILTGVNTYTGTTAVSNTNTILQIGSGGTTGNISAAAVTVNTGFLAFNRSDALTIANIIGGTGGLRQNGAGTTLLSGGNTYSGLTSINAGTLQISNSTALGTTAGNTNISSAAGSLAFSGGITVAENITINARNSGLHLLNVSDDNALTGTLTWASGGTAYGVRSDAGKLTINGPVNPQLGNKTLNVSGAGNVEFTGAIGNTATPGTALGIVKSGAGTLTLSASNTYTGGTTVSEGTLVLTTATALENSSTLTIASGAFVNLPNAGTEIVGTLVINNLTKPNGLYDSTNSGGAITGVGKIQVGAGVSTPFESWIATNYPGILAPDNTPSADPDHDGVPNILEFALNGNPSNGSQNGLTAALVQDSSAPVGNELTLVAAVRDGAVFTAGTATVDGITYVVEGSLDLSFPGSAVSSTGPSDTAPAATGLPSLAGTAWEYHTFKLDSSEGLAGKGFLRMKVTQP
ncbi:MAG: autotransporter-associated beta strand repeat-containing protein [Luteolibacter sp.]